MVDALGAEGRQFPSVGAYTACWQQGLNKPSGQPRKAFLGPAWWAQRAALAKVEHSLIKGFREYMYEAGFIEVQVPHITKATGACENIDTMFMLDYFGCLLYTSPSPRDRTRSRMPSSA